MQQDKAESRAPGTDMTMVEDSSGERTGEAVRKTLAMRIAHRNRLRAERLARLRAEPAASAAPTAKSPAEPVPKPASLGEASPPLTGPTAASASEAEDNAAALEEFLKALSQGGAAVSSPDATVRPADPEPASVLPFQRPPEAEMVSAPDRATRHSEPLAAPVCDLHRLEGAGPGLIWALQRSGIACLAEMAPLEATELASRLGYLGRLVPADTWIAQARMS